MRRKWMYIAPLAILGFALFLAIGGEVVRLLWNGLLPSLFGWREIGFWQALGLLALCRILFGGLGGGHHHGFRRRERWEQMSPEERERLRQRLLERCGLGAAAPASQGGEAAGGKP